MHADHGLAPESARWAEHCRRFCVALGVPLAVRELKVSGSGPQGPEAAARRARYRWFAGELRANDVLLTAHHLDDQAETVLLRLLRGAGVQGLAGMPALRPLGAGRLARPLLAFPRAELLAYDAEQRLAWIEDPANRDPRFDRSFLRCEIVPRLRARWPAASPLLAQAAGHQREAAALLDALAERDGAGAGLEPIPWAPGRRARLAPLTRLPPARQANALRFLLRCGGFAAPSTACLHRALPALFGDEARGGARVCCERLELRRYDEWLEMAGPLPPADSAWQWPWRGFPQPLPLPELGVRLFAAPDAAGATALRLAGTERISVRLRRGGERMRLPGRTHRRTLKNILNEARVPPWHRDRLPLLYVGEELAALPGVCVSASGACAAGERGWRIQMIAS